MHMADALVNPAVGGVMYVAAGAAAVYSIAQLKKDPEIEKKVPVMGVMGAFVFAAQMINFTIPGTGSSGHLCGGMVLTSLLGPYAGFLSMIGVLLIQCLFFADGGILTLGANIWNMSFYGCFLGAFIWRLIMKNGMTRGKLIAASILGCVITLQCGAFSVVLETSLSGITELPMSTFIGLMQPIHLAIGFVEGLITAAVACFVFQTRPEMLYCSTEDTASMPAKKVLGILSVCTVLIAGLLSLAASAFPDGLEWSIEKITGDTELEAAGNVYDLFGNVQDSTAFLPDYAFPGSESMLGTTVSGIVGCAIVAVVLVLIAVIIKNVRKAN